MGGGRGGGFLLHLKHEKISFSDFVIDSSESFILCIISCMYDTVWLKIIYKYICMVCSPLSLRYGAIEIIAIII